MGQDVIHTEDVPECPLCGEINRKVLYTGLRDRLFGAPGEWTFKECCGCGLVYLDPRPTPEDIGKAYTTYYTHSASMSPKGNSLIHRFYRAIKAGYLGKRWGYEHCLKPWQMTLGLLLYLHPGRRSQLDSTVMYLKAIPSGRLLDVGCGSGEFLERMRDLGWYAEGLDTDEVAVRRARERGLQVRLGTLEQQSYPEASFDAITSNHVIEHVHDFRTLLREFRRLLKPSGRAVVVTPNIGSLGHKYFKTDWRGLEPPRHLQIFSHFTLRRLAEEAGFQSISIWTTMQNAHSMYVASRSIEHSGTYVADAPALWDEWSRGRVMQHFEWAKLKINPELGEEVVAVLGKRNA